MRNKTSGLSQLVEEYITNNILKIIDPNSSEEEQLGAYDSLLSNIKKDPFFELNKRVLTLGQDPRPTTLDVPVPRAQGITTNKDALGQVLGYVHHQIDSLKRDIKKR